MRKQDRKAVAGAVSQDVTMECVDSDGQAMALEAVLGYNPADPFAMTATFRTPGGDVVWTFARDLLTQGLTDPAGDGDVHVWPCLDASGRAVVIIELCSPDGEALVQARTGDLQSFVERMNRAVAVGSESELVDVDAAISAIFAAENA